MKPTITISSVLLSLLLTASVASAQQQPNNEEVPLNPFAPRTAAPEPAPEPETQPEESQDQPTQPEATTAPEPQIYAAEPGTADDSQPLPYATPEPAPSKPKVRQKPLKKYPIVLAAPTAHLLPAAMIYSSTSIDTGGGFGSSLRVGLGDVGEFGVETTDRIRFVTTAGELAETVQPMVLASFKMGVAEDRLFDHQPALALGFRKSFQKEHDSYDLRVAAIELVASKTLGPVSLHAGGIFWDASMDDQIAGTSSVLHDHGTKRQIRPIAGLVAEPLKNAQLLVDLYWVPLFDPTQSNAKEQIVLRPSLSWGVRYKVGQSVSIESGVRVPDIGDANLLDAQIFGQLTFSSSKLRTALGVGE